MNLAAPPANDFAEFLHEYHARCRASVPRIVAIAAKWTFEDLIPGLSDFDTRFILRDPMGVADWQAMSLAVGAVHTAMCREHPRWARNLEHTPGVNLTVAELTNPLLFYPEFQQWTFYEGDADAIDAVKRGLASSAWSERDELYHLKRFATFHGRYQRGIDPPINLGAWTGKYPLHSRLMHYFAPPVQAAISLMSRRNVPGKLEAFRLARRLLPQPQVIDRVLEVIDRHYDVPELYEEPALTRLEDTLASYLDETWRSLTSHVSLVAIDEGDTPEDVRAKVAAAHGSPVTAFFASVKFGRLLEGRLRFYAEQIPHFESAYLIRNELGRARANLFTTPLTLYARVRYREQLGPEDTLDRIRGELVGAAMCEGAHRCADLLARPIPAGGERAAAIAVANTYESVLQLLECLASDMQERIAREAEPISGAASPTP